MSYNRPCRRAGRLPSKNHLSLRMISKRGKKCLSSLSVSLAVHAMILLMPGCFYVDLPNHRVFESILSLVGSNHDPLSDQFVIEKRESSGSELGREDAIASDEPIDLQDVLGPPALASQFSVPSISPDRDPTETPARRSANRHLPLYRKE